MSENKIKGTIVVDTLEKVWYRQVFEIDEENELTIEEFINRVKEGEIESEYGEYLYETVVDIEPKQNNENSTLQIYQDYCSDKNLLYENGK